MNVSNQSVLEELENVISKEKGLNLLWENSNVLNDELVNKLQIRANELIAAGDKDGAQEFEEWASEARNISTRREILSTSPDNYEEALQILNNKRERLDNDFIDFNVRIAGSHIKRLISALEDLKQGDREALTSAVKAADNATFEVGFLNILIQFTQQPSHQAQALLIEGTLFLLQTQLEEFEGHKEEAAGYRKKAEAALSACAENQSAPASLRARAEGNLATLAGREHIDEVNKHQAVAQRLAEEAGDLDYLRTVRRDRAYWARQNQNWEVAYDLYQHNIEDTERELWKLNSPILGMELVAATVQDYDAIVEVCLERAKTEPSYYERALEFVDQSKARAFLRSMANIGFALGSVPPRLLQRHEKIIRRMQNVGNYLAELKEKSPELAERLEERNLPEIRELQYALGVTENQIEKYSSLRAFNLQCAPCTFAEMITLVPPNSAILSYFTLRERILIFVIDEQGLTCPPVEIPLSEDDLARAVVNILATIRTRKYKTTYDQIQQKFDTEIAAYFVPTDNLHFLYHKLIEPVKDKIINRSLLYVVPHGSLRDLPFHALLQPNGEALIDEVAIAYTPSLSVLRQCSEHRRLDIKTCFAAGVSAEDNGPKSAQDEAAFVAQLFGVKPSPATPIEVLNQAMKCDLIHLSCHSNFGNPLTNFQGLALENNSFLSQQEIASMHCQASLVTLSACETAHSDTTPRVGEEMTGLVGAFIRAGCPSVIASLYPVADRVSLPMMNAFYTALKSGNTNKATALQKAQKAIKAMTEEGFDHPYFWAPFCLWGDICI